jgi:tetratricopeptide (TPR) repeat protein
MHAVSDHIYDARHDDDATVHAAVEKLLVTTPVVTQRMEVACQNWADGPDAVQDSKSIEIAAGVDCYASEANDEEKGDTLTTNRRPSLPTYLANASVAHGEDGRPMRASIDKPLGDDYVEKRGVSLAFLVEFRQKILGQKEKLLENAKAKGFDSVSTATVCSEICAKETAGRQCSYVDLFDGRTDINGAPFVSTANVFVSHAWRYNAIDTIDSMVQAAPKISSELGVTADIPLYFWFDVCVVCQHESGVKRSQSWWASTFKTTIAEIAYTLLILMPWKNPLPMTRAWCLWEMLSTIVGKCKLDCVMPHRQRLDFNQNMIENPGMVESTIKTLEALDARNATAWMENDKAMIFRAIEDTLGFDGLNKAIKDQMRKWILGTAQDEERSRAASLEDQPLEAYSGELQKIARLQFNLGSMLTTFGRYAEAEAVLLRGLRNISDDWRSTENHKDLAALYSNLGQASAGQKHYAEALEYYTQALAIHKDFGDLANPTIGITTLLMNFGVAAKNLNQLEQSMQYFAQCNRYAAALVVGTASEAELNTLFILQTDVLVNIGAVSNAAKKFEQAKQAYHSAELRYRERYGEDNIQLARVRVYLGNLSKNDAIRQLQKPADLRDAAVAYSACKEAMAYYDSALRIYGQTLGHDHPDSAGILRNKAAVYVLQRKFKEAGETFEQALAVYLGRGYPADHQDVRMVQNGLRVLKQKPGG